MSADNLPQSGSSQPQPSSKQDRYSRAGQTALQKAENALNRQRDKDRADRYAVAQQARADSEAAARRAIELSGKSSEMDQISALLGGDETPSRGRETQANGEGAQGSSSHPPKRQPADDGGSAPRREPSSADDLPDDEPQESGEGPQALVDYATEHELEIDELYKLTVRTDDGESYSLGELKDSAKRLRDLDSREADFEDTREALYSEITVKRQNVDALLNRLKHYVPAETLARAAIEAEGDPEAMRETATRQLREWFPEWRDNQAQQRDRERVETRLQAYGFAPQELRALLDPRVIRFLVETTRKLDRYDRLRTEGKREAQPTKQPPSARAKPSRTTSIEDRANAQAKAGDKLGAIATLLGE